MKKSTNYVAIILVAAVAASCTFAVYTQKNCTNSTQKVENPTSASADSASITIQTPLKSNDWLSIHSLSSSSHGF